ncbi:hypothetical protein [Segnochrobactrum spirostomi]|uniref:Secreted protein n=1 Tax=Segnochrobactrum spirostomi TaxID=2608987 RepID=A0A6A7Y0Q5_9HYPH|nr:hypothetical protein [Segnochrobactrum spirostomi]MQT11691.1 hypothetical protein [Segnochrobactrum spirostomi]
MNRHRLRAFVVVVACAMSGGVLAAEPDDFTARAGSVTIVTPGLWFTLKNTCSGAAYATVGDETCQLAIGSATFLRKLRSGKVPAGYSEMFNACAGSPGGSGKILFVPPVGTATAAVLVDVAPDSTVTIPSKFCE